MRNLMHRPLHPNPTHLFSSSRWEDGPSSSESLRTMCWASRRTARVASRLIDVFETVGRNETVGFIV